MNDKDMASWLLGFYYKVSEGAQIEYKQEGSDWTKFPTGPNMQANKDEWRAVNKPDEDEEAMLA